MAFLTDPDGFGELHTVKMIHSRSSWLTQDACQRVVKTDGQVAGRHTSDGKLQGRKWVASGAQVGGASWGHTLKVSVKRKHVSLRKWISFFCPALLPTEIRFGTTDRVGKFEQRWAEIR